MDERTAAGYHELRAILSDISFAASCVNLDWKWDLKPVFEQISDFTTALSNYVHLGWLIRTSFTRPDTDTGQIGRGFGRWEFIALGATESAVVKTCWVLAEMIVKHELMEAFKYKSIKIFNPHHTVEELSMPDRARKTRERLELAGRRVAEAEEEQDKRMT